MRTLIWIAINTSVIFLQLLPMFLKTNVGRRFLMMEVTYSMLTHSLADAARYSVSIYPVGSGPRLLIQVG